MEGNKKMDQRRIIDTREKKIKHRKWQYIIYSNYKLQSKHSSFVRQNTQHKKERKNIEYNHGISVHEEAM